MVHLRPDVPRSTRITPDGVHLGGDMSAANDMAARGDASGFDFKFFVQSTRWLPTVLEAEIASGLWLAADVDKRVMFKGRDRQGGKRAVPLWTEVMGLCDDDYYKAILEELYREEGGRDK